MKRTASLALTALLAGSPAAPALAQTDGSRPVRSTVETVAAEIDVLVLDSKGTPVEGLAREDFGLLVDGKERPIDWLEGPPGSVAPASSLAPGAGSATLPATASTAPAPAPASRAHSTVFVISDLHTDLRARRAGLEGLRAYAGSLPAGEPAAVYLLDNGIRRLLPFTTDRSALAKALEKPARMLPRSYVFTEVGGDEWVGQSRQMLRNFATVLDSLASRPEAKTVVVLSGPISATGYIEPIGGGAGSLASQVIPTNNTGVDGSTNVISNGGRSYAGRGLWSFRGEAKAAESQALLARATIVALDPTGLDSPDARAEINSLAIADRIHGMGSTLRPADASSEGDRTDTWAFRSDTLALIADSTGGARIGYSNRTADLLAAESRLLSMRYRLGFTPPDGSSARRDIRVTVARPGVVVRTAAGQRSLTPETAARARFAALLLSADAPRGDFAIALETKGPISRRADDAFPFDVLVPVSGVYAEERGDGKRAKLELLIAGVDEEGRASEPMVIPFSVTIDRSAPDGSFFRKDANFSLDRRWKGRLFVGVRDTATNRVGTVALPIGG